MAVVANRRSVMSLFSRPTCPYSHKVRIVLAEKNINVEIVDVDGSSVPEDLIDLNPYNSVPTLVDRDLVLYDSRVIVEYLDERFPHPPLMPVDPVTRAQFRLALYRIERDWYGLVDDLEGASDKGTKRASKARRILRDSILSSAEVFGAKNFFLSDEFSLVDATIAPIVWRLQHYGIELPDPQGEAIAKYQDRVFSRPSFQASLTELERELH
ncbi:MAG: stringent starvation protein A [Gammaproteobacteria bacterium]|nr:stringent starvation protein A [Gammaproteobacteria bacterium]